MSTVLFRLTLAVTLLVASPTLALASKLIGNG